LETDAARQSLAQDLARIEQWGATLLCDSRQASAVSFALFACSGAEVWVEFPSPIPDEIPAHFRQLLPPHIQYKIIDKARLDQRDTYDRILHVARETLEQHERIKDQESVRLLLVQQLLANRAF